MEKKELTFLERVLKVQTELKAPKGQFNKFGGYAYRSCEDILEAAKPLLAKYNLILFIGDEIVEIGGRIYVKATATIMDSTGNKIMSYAYAREEETKKGMDGSQITGASSSYARKYALNGLFLIDDTKDSDVTNTHGKDDKEQKKADEIPVKKATEKQLELLKKYVPTEEGQAKMLKWVGVTKLEDIPMDKASEIISQKVKEAKANE